MNGAISPLPQYAFMAWCSVKAQGQLYLYYQFHCIHVLTFKGRHLNPPPCSIRPRFKCPGHVRNAVCQKINHIYFIFKLETYNKNFIIQNESIFHLSHDQVFFFTQLRPVSLQVFFPFVKHFRTKAWRVRIFWRLLYKWWEISIHLSLFVAQE